MNIVTKSFNVSRAAIFFRLLMIYGKGMLISMAVLTVIVVILFITTADYRWLIVGLMIILIIVPMFMTLFYVNHALKPLTVLNALPHRIQLCDEGVTVYAQTEYAGDDGEKMVRKFERAISFSEFDGFMKGLNEVIFLIGGEGKDGILILPPEAVSSSEEYATLLDRLVSSINTIKQ